MDTATFIVDVVRALAWPVAIVVSVAIAAKTYRDQPNEGDE